MSQYSVYIFSSPLKPTVWYSVSRFGSRDALKAAECKTAFTRIEFMTELRDPGSFSTIMNNPSIIQVLKCPVSATGHVCKHHTPKDRCQLMINIVTRAASVSAYSEKILTDLMVGAQTGVRAACIKHLAIAVRTEIFPPGNSLVVTQLRNEMLVAPKILYSLAQILYPVEYVQAILSVINPGNLEPWATKYTHLDIFEKETLVKILFQARPDEMEI